MSDDVMLKYALEKIRTIELILLGVVMADPSPSNLLKNVEKCIEHSDATELFSEKMTDAEVVIARRAREDTLHAVFPEVRKRKEAAQDSGS